MIFFLKKVMGKFAYLKIMGKFAHRFKDKSYG